MISKLPNGLTLMLIKFREKIMKDLEKKGTFRKSGDWTSQKDLQKKLYATR